MGEETQDEAGRLLANMELWDRVQQTDLDHTKEVSFGRKFTAIDAHSQIMEATRQFGPVGQGWGYENVYGETHLQDGRVIAWCDVTLWWAKEGSWENIKTPGYHNTFGPVRGGAMLINDVKKKPDTDAYKKASTDGLTKLISHLGFNADVFLGMFDDNKYIQGLQKEKDEAAGTSAELYAQERAKFVEEIQGCKKPADMNKVLENWKLWINRLPPGTAVELRGWVEKQKVELKGKE